MMMMHRINREARIHHGLLGAERAADTLPHHPRTDTKTHKPTLG